MVGKRKRKYTEGEGSRYLSRRAAMNKLQLTMKDFRKLCILKGIYPREPINRKRAQKGVTGIKILYLKKDIQFLLHEPVISKLRDYKIFAKKVGRAKALRDFRLMRKYLDRHPQIKIDHIVKERYPTFVDAIRDLDDCLTLCSLFSTFPAMTAILPGQSHLCRRLTIEFMHAVIAAKALRKVFVSIKGYYFQAELKGQTVTWIVPHHFSFQPQSRAEVDFKVMSIFVEFYSIMLGFINFRLYHSLNLFYPPKFPGYSTVDMDTSLVDEESYVAERIAALNVPLSRTGGEAEEEEEPDFDSFQMTDDPEKQEQIKVELAKTKKLRTLFKGLKFFLNREVPREPLVFVIRCFGGEVSWDKISFVGALFDESDETITHHIVDRPSIDKEYLSRYYVQPQWIFDSVNACELLPVQKYFLGAVLPPHLSPFTNPIQDNLYIPPEAKALVDAFASEEVEDKRVESENDEEDNDEDDRRQFEEEEDSEDDSKSADVQSKQGKMDEMDSEEKARLERKKKMAVSAGTVVPEDPMEKTRQERQEYKLREKMIKKKHRNLYKSMMKGRQTRNKEKWLLGKKRDRIDNEESELKKADKKKKVKVTGDSSPV